MKGWRRDKMAKLRKMLGDVNQPEMIRLMRLIETQSKETLAKWAADCAEERYLAVYERHMPHDDRPRQTICAVKACLTGERKLTEVKEVLAAAVQAAKEAEKNPAAQAAARAISTACAVFRTPTNALGFTFYGAAAQAYDKAGAEERQEVYDALATEELRELIASLEKIMIPDEKKPAKINWNC